MRRSSTRRSRRSMSSSRRRFLSESLSFWPCGVRPARRARPGPPDRRLPLPPPPSELARSLDTLFATSPADRVVWGVSVRVPGGESLYQRNASLLLHPASNMKLVTLAAAAERLGWDFRFETTIRTTTSVSADGTVSGDLVVIGGGDPTISRRQRRPRDAGAPGRPRVAARRAAHRRPHHRRRIGVWRHVVRRRLAVGRPGLQLCGARECARLQREHRRVRRRARAVGRRCGADDAGR